MLITRTSKFTGITRSRDLDVSEEQWAAYNGGAHIQKVMPHLSDSDREFILTGMTDEEWDEMNDYDEDDFNVGLDEEEAAF